MSMALTAPPTRKRFLIVACLFIGIFIAYLDRVNVSVLAANEPFLAYMGIRYAIANRHDDDRLSGRLWYR